jgi:anti-sigma factor (TIGR02949 family)
MRPMDCDQNQNLLSAYIDGELAEARVAALEQHLQSCPTCRALYESERRMSEFLRTQGERFAAPAHLRAAIRTEIERRSRPRFAELRTLLLGWNPVAVAAALVLVAVSSAEVTVRYFAPAGGDHEAMVRTEVVASQVRSLQAGHLTDIASADAQAIKAWFTGKLNFSPPVADLSGAGYHLAGARLDYMDQRAVAALVYRRDQHVINVFVWAEGGEKAPSVEMQQGYSLGYYKHGGMEFWAVSDLSQSELEDFLTHMRATA